MAGDGSLRFFVGAEVSSGGSEDAGVGIIVGAREISGLGGLGVVAVAAGTACWSSSVRSINSRRKGLPFVWAVALEGWEGARGAGGAGHGIWFACC